VAARVDARRRATTRLRCFGGPAGSVAIDRAELGLVAGCAAHGNTLTTDRRRPREARRSGETERCSILRHDTHLRRMDGPRSAVNAFARYAASPAELQEQLAAVRRGAPFLVYRDGDGGQRVVGLEGRHRLSVGRDPDADVSLSWDTKVSRLHAELECVGSQWTVIDDGLSTNGSFVNGERVAGRRRLADGDALRFGATQILFRAPAHGHSSATALGDDIPTAETLSPAQRRVLVALCRPYKGSAPFATPATNQEIADELVLSVEAIKTHLRVLFQKFGVEHLPQNQKRARLVERALLSGIVTQREL
jgi:pSer/pThr/pTyr-binding forkhead associated (FHA) protein